jgi:hypothetical protein
MSWVKALMRDADAQQLKLRLTRAAKALPSTDPRSLSQRELDILRAGLLGAPAGSEGPEGSHVLGHGAVAPAGSEPVPGVAAVGGGSGDDARAGSAVGSTARSAVGSAAGGGDRAGAAFAVSGPGELLIVAPHKTLNDGSGGGEGSEEGSPGWIVGAGARAGQVAPQGVRALGARHGHRGIRVDPASGRLVSVEARGAAARVGGGVGEAHGGPVAGGRGGGPGTPETWMSETLWCDSYMPSPLLRLVVNLRDQHCRFPGCGVPATECDIDHVAPFNEWAPCAEQTVASNLHALCRTHHRAKHREGWRVRRDPTTGRTDWTSRSGQRIAVPAATLPRGCDRLVVAGGVGGGRRVNRSGSGLRIPVRRGIGGTGAGIGTGSGSGESDEPG